MSTSAAAQDDTLFAVVEGVSERPVAVVTAAGGPMGAAIARRLAPTHALVLNDRSADRLGTTAEALCAGGAAVVTVVGDVSDRATAVALRENAVARWGRLDALVNVAGGVKGPLNQPILDITDDQWSRTLDINLTSAFRCLQEAARVMADAGAGRIVNIGSTSWAGSPDRAHYAAAKSGLVALTRSAATQLGRHGITVNVIVLGATTTTVVDRRDGSWVQDWTAHNPLGRPNTVDDVADAVEFLLGPGSRNISGQALTVAGGLNPSL
ncbi:3-oxoacyl-[acyl-carrier-protein] reductase FabG [Amycolatopsis sp. YIM 10]|nr:3-oxoacyl-[acyl-carrier-protein] reductase FabG [Amycolatopsis sp. YIM 10]